uniref:Uncharacterized protein n=1 Tax=Chromera velia CCMP2878 TaxID=1169474 RepID=A0A0G4FZ75_9ALVE|eukprot:Cvel_19469.t1-p1 / transcript=Cvel_19469.t1 / gene=Cvel_19469 / organism=Chromera_velia_CCMP2878 / gene_product=hypothetical protein / transcript_product=hypothetical protein / location=Cvel_scaffold1681:2273-5556(+) / protein_length=899 / sequence_SO=supercontig / SO=protein_coding / is_pseudo=false
MSSASDSTFDLLHKLGSSGVSGIRLFWKLSSLSRGLQKLRQGDYLKDVLCPENQISLSERSELRSLVHDCIDKDDVKTLKQLSEVKSLSLLRRFPALLRRAYERSSLQCTAHFSQSPSFHASQEFSAASVGRMGKETLKVLIETGVLQPDAWFKAEDKWGGGMKLKYWKPLSIVLIEADNFECAEFLLDKGARADVCEWPVGEEEGAENGESPLRLSHRRHWESRCFCPGKTPLHSLLLASWRGETPQAEEAEQSAKLQLLHRLVTVASESKTRCLEWCSSVPLIDGAASNGSGGTETIREMCSLALACRVLDPQAVAVLLSSRKAVLGQKEGDELMSLAMGGVWREMVLGVSRIHKEAIEHRRVRVLKALAERGVDLSTETRSKDPMSTPLMAACVGDMGVVIDFLIQSGVSPKRKKGKDGEGAPVPLVICMQKKKWSIAKKLLEGGADPNEVHQSEGEKGVVAVEVYLKIAKQELRTGGNFELRMEVLEGLATAGANFHVRLSDGRTPLSFAVEWSLRSEVEFFLRHGVLLRGKEKEGGDDKDGLLGICIEREQWSLLYLLLEWGADPNEDSVYGVGWRRVLSLPLLEALKVLRKIKGMGGGDERVREAERAIRSLVEKGARCEPENKNLRKVVGEGEVLFCPVSPLQIACSLCMTDTVRLLVEKAGADPNTKGKTENSPYETPVLPLEFALHQCAFAQDEFAASSGGWGNAGDGGDGGDWWQLVTTLIQVGARPDLLGGKLGVASPWLNDIIRKYYEIPLLETIIRSLPKRVVTASKSGLVPDWARPLTSLGAALSVKYTEGVRALVHAGADLDSATGTQTVIGMGGQPPVGLFSTDPPLLLALFTGQWEAAEVLIQAGADTACAKKKWAGGVTDAATCLKDAPAALLSLIWTPQL